MAGVPPAFTPCSVTCMLTELPPGDRSCAQGLALGPTARPAPVREGLVTARRGGWMPQGPHLQQGNWGVSCPVSQGLQGG